MIALLFVLVIVAFAPSLIAFGNEGVSVVPTVVVGEAPLPPLPPLQIPAAAQRFAHAHATIAPDATHDNRQEFLNALDDHWRGIRVQNDPHLQLIADVARTLGWLVERAQAPR
jgi:hypothetical protein|tara:strand:+ start:341 stop:679 length:339 start_codon:yes stop_codon:yes gene_type:complete